MQADETCMGGKRRNLSKAKRKQLEGRGAVGDTPVPALEDHSHKRVQAKVVDNVQGQNPTGLCPGSCPARREGLHGRCARLQFHCQV